MRAAGTRSRDLSKYQGKNLGLLLLALALPAAFLYGRILLGTVGAYTGRMTTAQVSRLTLLSNAALVAFFVTQIFCAFYVQRLVPPRQSRLGRSLQYLAVLVLCIGLSVTGAVMFEAFGVALLVRTGHY